MLNAIKQGIDPLEKMVSRIGSELPPLRLAIDFMGFNRPQDRFAAYVEKVREVFRRHWPAIHVGELVGSGGFSDVFRATSDYDGVADFAIKILKPELLNVRKGRQYVPAEEEMRIKDVKKRFTNESYVQWSLSQSLSPSVAKSVVKVYDHGEFDSRSRFRFILMEWMRSTLRAYINDPANFANTPQQLGYKTALMIKIGAIIGNVHREGIIHRDIKPENILFTVCPENGPAQGADAADCPEVKLGDFGTVRWIRSYTSKYDAIIIGSQFYMSPEQVFAPDHIDPRADIYSFGIVCYELLFGAHPKNISRDTKNLVERLALEPPAPRMPPPDCGPLYDIIMKCMTDRRDRYQFMDQVLVEMKDFQGRMR